MKKEVEDILSENERRLAKIKEPFDPITGEGSVGDRVVLCLPDFVIPVQYIPVEMLENGLVRMLKEEGSVRKVVMRLRWEGQDNSQPVADYTEPDDEMVEEEMKKVADRLVRVRWYYDFAFWAAMMAKIKNKGGGENVLFWLNRPQREKLIPAFLEDVMNEKPVRIIIDKTRQWGCSTATEMFFGWMQMVRNVGLNSLIVGHVSATSADVEDMYKTMLEDYPVEALYEVGHPNINEAEAKWVSVGGKQNIHRVPQRNCKIKLGSAIAPENSRGGDYNLVHCTEVGLWMTAEGHDPAAIVQGATGGMLYAPNTMIVLESTAKGVGNYFHKEYVDAVEGKSQFKAIFVSWFEVDQNSIAFRDEWSRERFAEWLFENRNNATPENERQEAGSYMWWMWELGATLEALNWYVIERSKYSGSSAMREEYPSTWQESFVNSGANVFDPVLVERMRKSVKSARWRGELEGSVALGGMGSTDGTWFERRGVGGKKLLEDLKFVEDETGHLEIWSKPEIADEEDEMRIENRYLVVVDIGGRGEKADWSVICVFDRLGMMSGEKPVVVAQWYGHIDMDLLAWKAAQIAKWYDNALLVIESNTLETKDRERVVDGDQTPFILLQIKDAYDNLYYRKQSEENIKEGAPVKYGFHTNTATKPMIIATLVKVVREGAYVERDGGCLDEYRFYERRQNGSFGAVIGKHDDKLMTRAIGLHICFYEMEMVREVKRVRGGVSRVKVVERVGK